MKLILENDTLRGVIQPHVRVPPLMNHCWRSDKLLLMNVIACQFDIVWTDKVANHAKIANLLKEANPAAGSVVVLPEMFATGFSMNVADVTDDVDQLTQTFLRDLAKRYGIHIIAGIVTGTDKGRNEAVVIDPTGAETGRYCKLFPFSPMQEDVHYSSGDDVVTVSINGVSVAPFVCYDLRFPEIFRVAARRGAELMVVIANFPSPRERHWVSLLVARAIENQAFVVGVNRCGCDPNLEFPGHSMIIGPQGEILAEAASDEGVIEADLDFESLRDYRQRFPVLNDIRDDFLSK